jgi:ribosomal protein L11 methyltransferase
VLLPVHREVAGQLAARLRPGGSIIVSGVLDDQEPQVAAAYAGLSSTGRTTIGDWLGLVLR